MADEICPDCGGKRLKPEALAVTVGGRNLAEVSDLSVVDSRAFFRNLELDATGTLIAAPLLQEIDARLGFLTDVGLGYLTLSRSAVTLSGGEAQRIKLATELSRRSTGRTLYLLDEPTTGLHFDDVAKLMKLLLRLRDQGNTIIVIEHNVDVMRCADWIVDLGPGGGDAGGELVCEGPVAAIKSCSKSVTGRFL